MSGGSMSRYEQSDNLFNGIKVIVNQARIAQGLIDTAIANEDGGN